MKRFIKKVQESSLNQNLRKKFKGNEENASKSSRKISTTSFSNGSSRTKENVEGLDNTLSRGMIYQFKNLTKGYLLKRYKRFLADIQLDNGETVTVYCPNTGPMVGLLDEKLAEVRLSKSDNIKRKMAYTLEMIKVPNGTENGEWIGIHSALANKMVFNALEKKILHEVGEFTTIRSEVKYSKNSRIDFVLESEEKNTKQIMMEVKSVTLIEERHDNTKEPYRCAVFPDTVSTRAHKHVEELMDICKDRNKVSIQPTLLFLVQRGDCHAFSPCAVLDPKFAQLCKDSQKLGVQLLAYRCTIKVDYDDDSASVILNNCLPVE